MNVGCCLGYKPHDTSSAAAFAFRAIEELYGVVKMMSWWTFSDVFEEGGFPQTEFSGIYGLKTVQGIPKPGWRAFELLRDAGDRIFRADVVEHVDNSALLGPAQPQEQPTNLSNNTQVPLVSAWATVDSAKNATTSLRVYLSFWAVQVEGAPPLPNRTVSLTINFADLLTENAGTKADLHSRLPGLAYQYVIDEQHANPHQAWLNMGSPAHPNATELSKLLASSVIKRQPLPMEMVNDSAVHLSIFMSPNSAVMVNFSEALSGPIIN